MKGLFGTRAGLVIDLFLVLLVLLLPAMLVAVACVRRGKIRLHATIMMFSFVVFAVALVAFEMAVRFSPDPVPLATLPLLVHLPLAVPCLVLWVYQVATARRVLSNPAAHRRRGKILMLLLAATVATGIWLYVATFA